jgi:unsaturated pyranuronate lyase
MEKTKNPIHLNDIVAALGPEGISRKTLAYNAEAMLCHFDMKEGSKIPLHDHQHAQIGYIIEGKIKFLTETGNFIVNTGNSYVFEGLEKHGAEIIQASKVIEVFVPCRDEYKP